MKREIEIIVDAIKINIEIAKVNGKPLMAEVSMSEKSKEYIAKLIEEYGNSCYLDGKNDSKRQFCEKCGRPKTKANNTLELLCECNIDC